MGCVWFKCFVGRFFLVNKVLNNVFVFVMVWFKLKWIVWFFVLLELLMIIFLEGFKFMVFV